MKERFQLSYVLLSLFLIAFGAGICYWIISGWIFFYFPVLLILSLIPIFLFAGVLPFGYGLYFLFYQFKLLFVKDGE